MNACRADRTFRAVSSNCAVGPTAPATSPSHRTPKETTPLDPHAPLCYAHIARESGKNLRKKDAGIFGTHTSTSEVEAASASWHSESLLGHRDFQLGVDPRRRSERTQERVALLQSRRAT